MVSAEEHYRKSFAGKIGSAVQRSRHDPHVYTLAGRSAFLKRFWPEDESLSPAEAEARAQAALRAHMLRLCLASAKARSGRLAAKRTRAAKVAAIGGRNDGDD